MTSNGSDTQTISNLITYEDLSLSDLNEMEETFEGSNFPPSGWTLPESGYSWQGIEVSSGSDCQISNAAYVDNYSIDQNNVEAALMSPKINLEVFDNPTLSFDYAYVRYGNNYSDGLKVEISSDCGATWVTLWEAYGLDLATAPDQGSWWEPECSDWENLNISLSEATAETVNIRFVNVNGYGNSLFIDNINFVNNDGSINVVNPIQGCIDSNATNYNPIANIDDGSCSYVSYGGQNIILSQGWNIFSTYVVPSNASFDNVINPIQENIIIAKNYLGAAYLPDWDFNGIGDLNNLEGYQIKVNTNCTLTVEGQLIAPENASIPILQGWNIISYLRESSANAELVLEDISETLIIVKDFMGNAYLPNWNFNGIGDFQVGQGYQLKAYSPTELHYISNDSEYRISEQQKIENKTENIDFNLNTGSNMHLIIPEEAWSLNVKNGDEIYAYDAEGKMVGSSKVTLPNTVICFWGDDETTTYKDGLYTSEQWHIKLWSSASQTLNNIEIKHPGENTYLKNQIITAESVSIYEASENFQLFDAIPNPATNETLIRIYLEDDSKVLLNLFDIIGSHIQTISNGFYTKGYHEFNIDLSGLSAGTYLYQISTGGERKSKRLEVLK